MIPREIPDSLRSSAIVPPSAAEYEGAWTPVDALAVLAALEFSRLSVESAQAYKLVGMVLIPTQDAWQFPPTSGETESSRARKSRAGATSFIRKLNLDADYVSLQFSYQDEAA
jgi:hypothetical protein